MTQAQPNPQQLDEIQVIVYPGTGPFPDGWSGTFRPRVNLLVADNGVGKTWLQETLAKFGKEKLAVGDLTVYDHQTGIEAKVSFGRAEIHCRAGQRPKGEQLGAAPRVELLPEIIGILISGDHKKGQLPALKARLTALLRWIGFVADDAMVENLIGQDSEIQRAVAIRNQPDAIEAAKAIRAAIHILRQEEEARLEVVVEKYRGEFGKREGGMDGFAANLVSSTVPTIGTVSAAASAARDKVGEVKANHRAGLEAQQRLDKVRSTLGERPDLSAAETRAEEAEAAQEAAAEKCGTATGEVQRIKEELARAEEALRSTIAADRTAKLATEQARQDLRRQQEQLASWERNQEELARKLEFPSEEDVAAAEQASARAEEKLRLHQAAERYGRLTVEIDRLQEQSKGHRARVKFLKNEAEAVWTRLIDEVNQKMKSDRIRISTTEIEDEKTGEVERIEVIEVRVGNRWVDIADKDQVSEGLRHAAVYDLMLEHRSGQRVICITGTSTVGGARLNELGEQAMAKGIILILETPHHPTPGCMRLEHYPPIEEEAVN